VKVDVIMPQMGESIAEGTITKWFKKIGDQVKRDEPLFEISTDKVDAEIPSPAEGIVAEILVPEGETVPIKTVVARLETESPAATVSRPTPDQPMPKAAVDFPSPSDKARGLQTTLPPYAWEKEKKAITLTIPEDRSTVRSSPVVRKLAREYGVDLAQVPGTGSGGRITKRDLLNYIETVSTLPTPPAAEERQVTLPPSFASDRVEVVPMTVMRKKIAEHMILSHRTSAHVTTVFEIDMTRVSQLRNQWNDAFQTRYGVRLTYLPFITKSVIEALKAYPILNSSVAEDKIIYKKDINIGIAVALEGGLIVPVIKNAEEKSLVGLAKAIQDLAARARAKQLRPDDVQGGTFTITNPGLFGSLFGTPIINQPQVAILGVGNIAKRPVVVETATGDALAIRTTAYFALSFDHRIIDGAVADQFMSHLKRLLENFETSGE
jgi:pyruvate dehydrogenase E2 component (dihydrolipoamide acetyltransferase)